MTGKSFYRTTSSNRLGLNYTSNDYSAYRVIHTKNVLNKLYDRFPAIHHGVYQEYGVLPLEVMEFDVGGSVSMYKHGKRKSVVDTQSHIFSAADRATIEV